MVMSMFPAQEDIDAYYNEKKREVSAWVVAYADSLKRVTKTQKSTILTYANQLTFSSVGELNNYVQELKTVSQRDKKRLFEYLRAIEWLPEEVNSGVLDGQIVSRILPNDLDLLLDKLKRKK